MIKKLLQRSLYFPVCFLLGIALTAQAGTESADERAYRLYAGDSIAVSSYSHPTLSGTFRLNERGQFLFPLIGPMIGSGLTTEEIRNNLADLLKERVDGNLELRVAVLEYRPVYIDGDVISPGAYPYRPGMTVSIAVTLAGGRQSVRSSSSLIGLSHEQEQFEILLDTYQVNVAREARLLAEMTGKKSVDFPEDIEAAANSSPRVREILENERAIMASRLKLQGLEADSLTQRIKGLTQVIQELEAQKDSIDSRRKLYEKQFEDIRKITAQGIVPKATLLRLQITATTLDQEARAADIILIQSRQSLEAAQTQLDNLPTERKAKNTAVLQDVQDSLAKSRIQFNQSLRRLASLNSQAPPELGSKVEDSPPVIGISRVAETVAKPPLMIEVYWDSPVLPGDVIRIPYPEFSAPGAFDSGLPMRVNPIQN